MGGGGLPRLPASRAERDDLGAFGLQPPRDDRWLLAQAHKAAGDKPRLPLINGGQRVNLLARHGVGVKHGRYGEIVLASADEQAPTPNSGQ
jgi:hypothetical protein